MSLPSSRVSDAATIILPALGLLLLGAWLSLAVVHLGDRYAVTGTSSVWMGLAYYARHGLLFPPLFDGEHVAGTRYMPLSILAHAGLASLTGEYLVSGKLLGLFSGIAIGIVLVAALRRVGARLRLALPLAAVVLASPVGMVTTMGMRPEAIPSGLQLAAVAVVLSSHRRRSLGLAAILCAFAIMAKITAIYAPIAIVFWLLRRHPRAAVAFGAMFAIATFTLFGVVTLVSEGRIWTNLLELGSAGLSLTDIVTVPTRLLAHLGAEPGVFLLVPFALVAVVLGWKARAVSLAQAALIVAALVTLFIYTDRGADYNHLLDVALLTALVAGEFAARSWTATSGGQHMQPAFAAALVVGMVATLTVGPGIDLALVARHALTRGAEPMYDAAPLRGLVAPADEVLSDTAYLAVSRGQQPVVLDPFMLGRIGQRQPEVVQDLAARVRRGEFKAIVLQFDIDGLDFPAFFGPQDVGAKVSAAIREHYRLERVLVTEDLSFTFSSPPLYVYVPD